MWHRGITRNPPSTGFWSPRRIPRPQLAFRNARGASGTSSARLIVRAPTPGRRPRPPGRACASPSTPRAAARSRARPSWWAGARASPTHHGSRPEPRGVTRYFPSTGSTGSRRPSQPQPGRGCHGRKVRGLVVPVWVRDLASIARCRSPALSSTTPPTSWAYRHENYRASRPGRTRSLVGRARPRERREVGRLFRGSRLRRAPLFSRRVIPRCGRLVRRSGHVHERIVPDDFQARRPSRSISLMQLRVRETPDPFHHGLPARHRPWLLIRPHAGRVTRRDAGAPHVHRNVPVRPCAAVCGAGSRSP